MPFKQLAAELYMSSPAAAARVAKLEESGVITGYTAKIDRKKLGYPITAFVNLELQPAQKAEFYPFVEKRENILECHCVTGRHSILLKVAFESTEKLDAFINELQKFGATDTKIVFSTVKENTGITGGTGNGSER